MSKTLIVFIFLSLFTVVTLAEVYKCADGDSVRFSTEACDSEFFDLALAEQTPHEELTQEEFIVPVYPGWKGGWKKIKEIKLEQFFEIEYIPNYPQQSDIKAFINQQTLSNIPQSMTIHHFALSIAGIIDSICEKVLFSDSEVNKQTLNSVYYGQYICSLRRDSKKGELGLYKIIRGEKSVYMLIMKWSVAPFIMEPGKEPAILKNREMKNSLNRAKKYLQQDVKLCKGTMCY